MAETVAQTEKKDECKFEAPKLHKQQNPHADPVVLLGCGSFSPVTFMHLRMFESAKDAIKLRRPQWELIGGFMSPVADAYGKKGLAPAVDRLEMCRLATANSDWIMIDPWEANQPSYSTTIRVLKHIHSEVNKLVKTGEKPIRVLLLCGSDLLESFQPGVWDIADMHSILGDFGVVVLERSGTSAETVIYNNPYVFPHQGNILLVPQWIMNEVSSTKVRQFISRGLSLKYLTPDPVIDYIHHKNLWKDFEQQQMQQSAKK